MDFFCKKCTLQFGKKYVFDLHLSLVHGEKMEVKIEPKICEENFQDPQTSELSRSAHRTPNFTNPEFQFPQFKVLQSVFFSF